MSASDNPRDLYVFGALKALHEVFTFACTLESEGRQLQLPSVIDAPMPSSSDAVAFHAVMLCTAERVVAPDWAAERVSKAWARFCQYKHVSIGEAFGVPPHPHAHARRGERYIVCFAMFCRVIELKDQGNSSKANRQRKGALAIAAEEFCVSKPTLEARIRRWKRLCAGAGIDPEAHARELLRNPRDFAATEKDKFNAAMGGMMAAWIGPGN